MKLAAILAAKGGRVVTIGPNESIRTAVAELSLHNLGAIIVVGEDGLPVGMLSERDIIRRLAHNDAVLDLKVADLMTYPVTSGSPDDDVDSILRMMTEKRFRHVPVIDREELVGIVTIGDLVKAEVLDFRGTIETLETQLMES